VAEIRACEQCGTVFAPRREHARFCSPRCRTGWNRENGSDLTADASSLHGSITAMTETMERLLVMRAWDRPRAVAAIGEAVWQVTLVDATLVRHHPDTYGRVMANQTLVQRRLTEQTLAGLRYVRNHIGTEASLAALFYPRGPRVPHARITSWTWRPVPEPALASPPPRGQSRELARYQAYRVYLAGHTVGQTFGRATAFLNLAAANAASVTGLGAHDRQ
jgi:hypothetical protein